MKTKEQIRKYISQCNFPDEDWQQVLDYCQKQSVGGRVRKALKPLSESTYQQFLDWIDNGYGVGDIVRYGHTLGILGAYTPDYAYLAVYLSLDDELIEDKLEIPKYKIMKSSEGDRQKICNLLKSMDVVFSEASACLMKTYQPDNGDIVRVTIGDLQTTGIFRVNDGSNLYFYAFVQDGKIVKNHTATVGSVTISKPTKTDVERLQIALAKNKMEWFARRKELRVVENARAAKGGRYWYLSELFFISSDIDMYTKKHNERHKNGNYFCAYGTAVLFAQKVIDLRKEIAGTN